MAEPKFAPIKAKRRVFLTGTPIVNRPIELWPIVRALDPQGLGKSWFAYTNRYCGAVQTRYGVDVSGASNLDELQTKLRATCMVRRLKSEVLTDLPPKVRQVIEIPAAGMESLVATERAQYAQHRGEIERLQAEAEALREQGGVDYAEAVEKLQEATGAAFTEMSKIRHELALAKLPHVIEHVEAALENVDKVVVMCWHHDVVQALTQHFGRAAVEVSGKVAIADRQAAVERFQTDKTCRVFVGTIKAAGVGLTLTASSTVIFAELWWVPGDISQAEDRCHRIGQTDSVLVQHLVVDGSLDATQAKTIVEKQDVIDRALDRGQVPVAAPVLLQQPVERLFDAVAPLAPLPAAKAAPAASLLGLVEYMDKAAQKLSQPRVRIAFGDGEILISRAGKDSRNPGAVYIKVDGAYVGKVGRDGRFSVAGVAAVDKADIEAALTAFLADPENTAKAYGKIRMACCFCGKDLTHPSSREVGYGPDCADNYGLPWG
jgi:hypothetical protein